MNLAASALLILLAPLVREPVGLSGWEKQRDPVRRRVESLLAGGELKSGIVRVVPLYARVPSEAKHGDEAVPQWAGFELRGEEVDAGGTGFARVRNPTGGPVLVCAGTYLRSGSRELHLGRDAIVPAKFAALLPARSNHHGLAPDHAQWGFRVKGVLPPLATGLLLHRPDKRPDEILEPWLRRFQAPGFLELAEFADVRKASRQLRNACAPLLDRKNETIVGAVFLIAGDVVGAHVFSSRSLFVQAIPELLHGLCIQSVSREMAVGRLGSEQWRRLRLLSSNTNSRARALAFLRGVSRVKGAWGESYGEGFEVLIQAPEQRTVGHAVVDHRRRVVHLAFYALGGHWDGRFAPAGTVLQPPVRPGAGGSEAPPGQVDRKARPSLAEARTRPRRPGPSEPTGGGSSRPPIR